MTYQSNIPSFRQISEDEAALVAGGYDEYGYAGCVIGVDGSIIPDYWDYMMALASAERGYDIGSGEVILVWHDGSGTIYSNGQPVQEVHNIVITSNVTGGLAVGASGDGVTITVNIGGNQSLSYTLGKRGG